MNGVRLSQLTFMVIVCCASLRSPSEISSIDVGGLRRPRLIHVDSVVRGGGAVCQHSPPPLATSIISGEQKCHLRGD